MAQILSRAQPLVDIETTLLSVSASREEIDRFLRHNWYTRMQAVLATSLEALDGVEGRAEVHSR